MNSDSINRNAWVQVLKTRPHTLKIDSRDVKDGDTFVAINGDECDGHGYIKDALSKGASCIICERIPEGIPETDTNKIVVVKNTRETISDISGEIYNAPSDHLLFMALQEPMVRLLQFF